MLKDKKILLVDDEADFLDILGRFFSRRQIEFDTAGNCQTALELVGRRDFHVIVMDVSMPGIDGLACMAEVKKLKPGIEVIILTGHASLNMGLLGMKKGAFDYCLKPVDFDELLEKIKLAAEAAAGSIR